jgi:hypothetical protein
MFTQTPRISPPGVSDVTYRQTHSPQNATMKRSDSYKVLKAVVGAIAVALAATAFYTVREFLAALLIFSVLFGAVGTALLILILLQEAALRGVIQIESHLTNVRARYAAAAVQPDNDPRLRSPRWN